MISPAVDLGDLADHAVHELAVVRGHEQRAGKRLQEALEPDDRLDVEVIGRLVHQQDVGSPEQHTRHRHAHLPAAGQRAHVALDPLVVEAEPVQHFARLRLEAVAAKVVVFLLHFAEAREDAIHLAGLRRVGHGMLQRLELMVQVAEAAAAGNGLVEHGAARHLLDVLAEVADRQLLRHRYVALVGRLFPDDHAKQRRLAGAVRPDEADLFSRIELEGGVDEEHLFAVLLADSGEGNHQTNISPWATSTACPPTLTSVIASRSPVIAMWILLGRPIATPCMLMMCWACAPSTSPCCTM